MRLSFLMVQLSLKKSRLLYTVKVIEIELNLGTDELLYINSIVILR